MRLLAGASPDLKSDERAEERPGRMSKPARRCARCWRDCAIRGDWPPLTPESGLHATLRPYQRDGVAWLHFLTELGLGACLADDMGLGKTLQVLALLLAQRKTRPAPVAPGRAGFAVGQLAGEAERFTPSLRLVSSTRRRRINRRWSKCPGTAKQLAGADLAVTTYSMLARQEWLAQINWRLVDSRRGPGDQKPGHRPEQGGKKIPAKARIVLTGTPVENRLGDLWSIFDFLNPGLLGSATVFKSFMKTLASAASESVRAAAPPGRPVHPAAHEDRPPIIADLPEKVETTRFCNLTHGTGQALRAGRAVR